MFETTFDTETEKYIKGEAKDYGDREFENEAHDAAEKHANEALDLKGDDKKSSP
jgi:hypothetical protein